MSWGVPLIRSRYLSSTRGGNSWADEKRGSVGNSIFDIQLTFWLSIRMRWELEWPLQNVVALKHAAIKLEMAQPELRLMMITLECSFCCFPSSDGLFLLANRSSSSRGPALSLCLLMWHYHHPFRINSNANNNDTSWWANGGKWLTDWPVSLHHKLHLLTLWPVDGCPASQKVRPFGHMQQEVGWGPIITAIRSLEQEGCPSAVECGFQQLNNANWCICISRNSSSFHVDQEASAAE